MRPNEIIRDEMFLRLNGTAELNYNEWGCYCHLPKATSLRIECFLRFTPIAMNTTALSTNPFELPSDIAVLVIGILGIITNVILLLVMFLDPLKCFRRPSMYFVISLAFSDLATSITSCLISMKKHVKLEYFIKFNDSTIWASVENSFITILLMAIERFIVIRYPMKAKSIVTKGRIYIAIAVTWLVSIVLGAGVSFPEPYGNYVKFAILIECFLIILVMLGIYFRMAVLLKKSSKIFRGKQFTRHGSCEPGKKPKNGTYERSLNMVVFYLALVLIITVLPHLLIGQIYLGYCLFYPTRPRPVFLEYAPYISFPVELLNFVLNSVIYAYRLPQFRNALCYYFKKKEKNERRAGSFSLFHRSSSKHDPASDLMMV